jgi:ABC-type phosphate transport system auxiliary subunit
MEDRKFELVYETIKDINKNTTKKLNDLIEKMQEEREFLRTFLSWNVEEMGTLSQVESMTREILTSFDRFLIESVEKDDPVSFLEEMVEKVHEMFLGRLIEFYYPNSTSASSRMIEGLCKHQAYKRLVNVLKHEYNI